MHHLVAPERIVASAALVQLESVLERHVFGKKLLLVCDDATWHAAGNAVTQRLESRYILTRLSLGVAPHATMDHARHVAAATLMDGLIAVGAGTVNDITKYAAASGNKPYLCVATAASMNGYISANASLIENGLKQSYAARAPLAVVADTDVLVAAPARLARAGLADTLCRSTVEADMLLSHLLRDTPYPAEIFARLRANEMALMRDAARLKTGDADYLALLMHALLDAGDAMNTHGSSALASQGEHMIAHTLELLYGEKISHLTHGEVIAITSVTMEHLQRTCMAEMITPTAMPLDLCQFKTIFGIALGGDLATAYPRKLLSAEQRQRLHTDWPKMRAQFQTIMHAQGVLEKTLTAAGLNVSPAALGVDAAAYETAVKSAHLTRDRFTFLDIAAMRAAA